MDYDDMEGVFTDTFEDIFYSKNTAKWRKIPRNLLK